jgi:hypothetical protein
MFDACSDLPHLPHLGYGTGTASTAMPVAAPPPRIGVWGGARQKSGGQVRYGKLNLR